MPSQFLPIDAEQAVINLLTRQLSGVHVGSIGELKLDDDDQLVWDPPMARTYYAGTKYMNPGDNQWLTYNTTHLLQIWCNAENLVSKQAQRDATKLLVGQVLGIIAGARVVLPSDETKSEPVELDQILSADDEEFGKIYVITIRVPGIAQFPGPNA